MDQTLKRPRPEKDGNNPQRAWTAACAAALREIRRSLGLQQKALGVDERTIRNWETARGSPQAATAAALKKALEAAEVSWTDPRAAPLAEFFNITQDDLSRATPKKNLPLRPLHGVAFDLDGTLLRARPDSSVAFNYSWQLVWRMLFGERQGEILRRAGVQTYLAEKARDPRKANEAYARWAAYCERHFRDAGATRDQLANMVTSTLRLVDHAREGLRTLREHGLKLYLISGGIDTFLQVALPDHEKYFHAAFINRFVWHPTTGALDHVVPTRFDFEHKTTALLEIARSANVPVESIVWVGEGWNDKAPVGTVFSIFFSRAAVAEMREMANAVVDSDDLLDVVKVIEDVGHLRFESKT
jgi:phosphoserine phosphatase